MKKEIKEGAFIYCSKDNAPYNLMGVIIEDGLNLFLKLIRDCFLFEEVSANIREVYDVTESLIKYNETEFKNLKFKLEFKSTENNSEKACIREPYLFTNN